MAPILKFHNLINFQLFKNCANPNTILEKSNFAICNLPCFLYDKSSCICKINACVHKCLSTQNNCVRFTGIAINYNAVVSVF